MTQRRTGRTIAALCPVAALLTGCELGPNYMRPAAPVPMQYREIDGWMPATPKQAAGWENWWAVYNDPVLDDLEKQVDISNQNLIAAEAAYRVARAQVGIQRASLLPTLNASAGARGAGTFGSSGTGSASSGTGTGSTGTGNTGSGNTGAGSGGAGTGSSGGRGGVSAITYSLGLDASWDIDVWGRIRRSVEASVATAQASAADISAARLAAQAQLAADYFQLRVADLQTQSYTAAVADFQMALTIAQNRLQVGIATMADVYTAQTQVDNAEAQLFNFQLVRDRMEHAIAALVGKTPDEVAIAAAPLSEDVPVVPAEVPSTLLQRRPDIASAEFSVASANAEIGVALAAWYPDLSLSGSLGAVATSLGGLFKASNATWSLGPSIAETVFNGGARVATNLQAQARYDQAVANYRQTVLTAFQQVEDQLATLKILEEEAAAQNRTVNDARLAEELTLNQYRAGTADFAAVIIAQTARLNAETSALNVLNGRLSGSVNFIMALGGGWDESRVPQPGFFYTLPETTRNDGPLQDAKSEAESSAQPTGNFFQRLFHAIDTP
jgi:NodT family efflux transporter outer membrane factor (OMF) lipoprotein